MRAHGLDAPASPPIVGGFTEVGGAEAMESLLENGRCPAAVVCANDEMAIGVLRILRAARLSVPTDVAVTGFDDIASARHLRPALTTVHQPMRDVGQLAVETLLARIADAQARRRSVVLPTEPRIRRSCGCGVRTAATKATRPSTSKRTTTTQPSTRTRKRP
jgi:LacI family transcriptional regulator